VFTQPKHEYTRQLLAAVPRPEPDVAGPAAPDPDVAGPAAPDPSRR
jgi:ABC-type oligopeptide transport system ATPase subunit